MHTLTPLAQALQSPADFTGWLYLPNSPWTLETEGFFHSTNLDLSPEEDKAERDAFLHDGWLPIVTATEIEDIIDNLECQLDEAPSMQQRLAALIFFYENDAFLEVD